MSFIKECLRRTFVHDIYHEIRHAWKVACDEAHYRILLVAKLHSFTLSSAVLKDLSRLTYQDAEYILRRVGRESFQCFMKKVYQKSTGALSTKDKIDVAFILYDASMWCGDRLYRWFEKDERFRPCVMLCLRQDEKDDPDVQKDFQRGVDQLRSNGLVVVPVTKDGEAAVKNIDVYMYLTPYDDVLIQEFAIRELTLDKLVTYIPYSVTVWGGQSFELSDDFIMRHAWWVFGETQYNCDMAEQHCGAGGWRARFTGLPKLDAFYTSEDGSFPWKLPNPSAKKIVYAPHWSIDGGCLYATFQWNYEFFYEYAKAHPDTTSWVVKPHPNLLFSAVRSGLFSSSEEFEEYLRKWDELPNAMVYTGAYYQDLFLTSDAMILDSGSFLCEYQYLHKPILFLARQGQYFNAVGQAAFHASYTVDGKDIEGITKFIEDVVIRGGDYKKEEREIMTQKILDYRYLNGDLASDRIYQIVCYGIWKEW